VHHKVHSGKISNLITFDNKYLSFFLIYIDGKSAKRYRNNVKNMQNFSNNHDMDLVGTKDSIPELFTSLNDFANLKLRNDNKDLSHLSDIQESVTGSKKVDLDLNSPLLKIKQAEKRDSITTEPCEDEQDEKEYNIDEQIDVKNVKVYVARDTIDRSRSITNEFVL